MPADYDPRAFFIFMNIENKIEIWKDVPDYNGYQVSSFGRVKSFKLCRGVSERTLKPADDGHGYLGVALLKNGKQKTFKIHVLVAMAFLGHVPDGHEIVVDHINNIKTDNRLINLRLTNNRENCSKDTKGTNNFTGVFWSKDRNKWRASIYFNDRRVHLGYFDSEIDAANAYEKAKKEAEQGLDINILYPKGKHKTSKFVGVSLIKSSLKWRAIYRGKHLGVYDTELEANEAVQNYIAQLKSIS